jgi:2-polyprenyl-3-methyl-5-hydroxy-6-metoxy-1,4-benzoquinol methylase
MEFSFGKNWMRFLRSVNKERLEIAERSISEFVGSDLRDRDFLDIGCGSGLFSMAAYRLKAKSVTSFDLDPFSVECCRYMRKGAGSPANWKVLEGSVLDRKFLAGLGKYDIVYSWGVLHHTGRMWEAIRNSASLVRPGGLFYIALYNRKGGPLGSRFWLRVKLLYNSLPGAGKMSMEMAYFIVSTAKNAAKMTPMSGLKNYKSFRGMDWKTDITDWLGGYPFEYATAEEIIGFAKESLPGFRLVNIKRTESVMGNNWFLFRRDAA